MIYLDNAATTRPAPQVRDAVLAALESRWGNPSSVHSAGIAAREVVESARRTIAQWCGVDPSGVVFTSGGTEANQLAALGLPLRSGTSRIVTTAAEHPSLARSLAARAGATLVEVGLDPSGVVDCSRLASVLDRSVGLVAMFEGQNEIGSRNPVPAIVELVRRLAPRALVHLDSVQSFGKPSPPPFEAGIDSAAISGHKIHGPKGVGALLLRTRAPLQPQLLGGGQEGDRRSGTENVPGIAGLGAAVELLARARPSDHEAMRRRRDRLERELVARIPDARVLATGPSSLPHVVTLVIPSAPGEVVLHHLEREDIAASAGAACHAGGGKLSPALLALGLREDEVRCTVRLSLSRDTTDAEIDAAATALPRIAERVRALGAAR